MNDPVHLAQSGGRSVHRPATGLVVAGGWALLGGFLLVDVLARGDGRSQRIAVAALLLVTALVYALAVRPAVVADAERVVLRNVVRDVVVPWSRVTDIGERWSLTVETDRGTYGSWAVTGGGRAPVRAADPARVDTISAVAAELRERWRLADTAGGAGDTGAGAGEVRRSWAWPAIGPLVAAALLVVLAVGS